MTYAVMTAVLTTAALILCALAGAVALTWRRHVSAPVRVEAKVEGPTCTPRVKR